MYIPDAYLHSRGTGYFTSHEGCAFINETGRDAHVRFTFYFQDREPMTGYTSVVPARRTKHARFDLMENDKGEPVPHECRLCRGCGERHGYAGPVQPL